MDGQARQHSRYSPSTMERVELCPGSDKLLERLSIPHKDTIYSIEGTKAHAVIDHGLTTGIRSAKAAHADSVLFAEDFDADFHRAVQVMLDYVYGIMDQHPDAVMSLEQYIEPPSDAAPGEVGGYCDVAIYIPSAKTLYVIDYKHGAGVVKHISRTGGSPQPWQYAAGLMFDVNKPAIDPEGLDIVVLALVQPRAFHPDGAVRELEVTPYEVFEYLERMDVAIRKAQEPNAVLIPGETQCQFCAANTDCPARMQRALAVINTTFKTVYDVTAPGIPDPATLSPEQLGYIKQMMPLLKQWMDDIDGRILEVLQAGGTVPGQKIVETQARRKWYGEPQDVAVKLAALIGCPVEDVMEYKLIGVTDAQALVVDAYKARAARGQKMKAAEAAKNAMAYLTLKQSSGNLTVVPDNDPRPAVIKGPGAFVQLGAIPAPGEAE